MNTTISVGNSFAFHQQLQKTLHNPHFYFTSKNNVPISSAEMVAVHIRWVTQFPTMNHKVVLITETSVHSLSSAVGQGALWQAGQNIRCWQFTASCNA